MDKAHINTDKRLAIIEKRLTAMYKRASDEIVKKADEHLKQFTKEDKKMLEQMKKGVISRKQYTAWRKREFLKRRHFAVLFEQLSEDIANVNKTALAYINGEMPEVYALNINAVNEGIADTVGGYSYNIVNADTVRLLAEDDPTLLPYRELDIAEDERWNNKKINAEVLQGIVQGETMNEIAGRMATVVGMNKASAIRNARTMVTAAENRGRMDGFHRAEESGIILKKVWMSTLDRRTRHWHSELHGQVAEVDEPFNNEFGEIMYPGDPAAHPANVYNCRCTIASVVEGFRKVRK